MSDFFENVEINRFANTENLHNFSWCVAVNIAATELCKRIFVYVNPQIFVVFFAIFLCIIQWIVSERTEENSLKKLAITFINTLLLAVASMGFYDIGLKFLMNKISQIVGG